MGVPRPPSLSLLAAREVDMTRRDDTQDRKLVTAFLERGDEHAFRSLYRRHAPVLYGLAMRLSAGNEAEAEEAVQTTWIRAAERLDGFQWRSALRSWLCGILVNCCREARRGRERSSRETELTEALAQEGGTPFNGVGRVDLERAIARLPGGFREVLILHDVEGYTHEEIAGFLGIQAGTSKSQLSRARRAMRVWLNQDERRQHERQAL